MDRSRGGKPVFVLQTYEVSPKSFFCDEPPRRSRHSQTVFTIEIVLLCLQPWPVVVIFVANRRKPERVICLQDRIAGKELSQKLSERLSNLSETMEERLSPGAPPPPPPVSVDASAANVSETGVLQPPVEAASNGTLKAKTKGKAPPVPVKTSTLSYNQPPPCPTPDYDTLSITSTASLPKQNGFKPSQNANDSVEMDSLESFKLNNPGGIRPKPPDTYFNRSPLGSGTNTVRKARPVSVTIGEYPSGTMRRTPGRLDFLHGGADGPKSPNVPISNQLASELAMTLNRSNLRKRTESMVGRGGAPTW
jgi:hypothetical protein